MVHRKIKIALCVLMLANIIFLFGCSTQDNTKDMRKENSAEVTNETDSFMGNSVTTKDISVFNEKPTDTKELAIIGGCCEYEISLSDTDNLVIEAELITWKGNDSVRKEKSDELNITVRTGQTNKLVLEELTTSNLDKNYWEWLRDKKINGETKIKYIIKCPSSIKKVQLYTDNGDISINDIDAEFDVRTFLGNVKCTRITPNGNSNFNSRYGNSEIQIDTMKKADGIAAISYTNKVTLLLPEDEKYNKTTVTQGNLLDLNADFENLISSDRIRMMKAIFDKKTEIDFFKSDTVDNGTNIFVYEKL